MGHGASVTVFRQRRSPQDQSRHVRHLEDIVRGDEHCVRVDLRFNQADQVFNDCTNGFRSRSPGSNERFHWVLTGAVPFVRRLSSPDPTEWAVVFQNQKTFFEKDY